jgi:ERCC4-type nuclease
MSFIVAVDDREKLPYSFDATGPDFQVDVQHLKTGDYTIAGFEDVFAVERKSIPDLVQSVTWGRKNFEAEIGRAQDMADWAIVIEGSPGDVSKYIEAQRRYGAKVHPNSVLGTVRSWNDYKNANFEWCGSREAAQARTYELLRKWYMKHHHLYESSP